MIVFFTDTQSPTSSYTLKMQKTSNANTETGGKIGRPSEVFTLSQIPASLVVFGSSLRLFLALLVILDSVDLHLTAIK